MSNFSRDEQTLIWVDLNEVKIVSWVRRRTLKTRKVIKWGFKCHKFFQKILCLQVSVLIIHWHCFQVSYTLAQIKQKN